jgi:catechol 2,3-dioxygenase-like lactoylglutathione lyase family enzyme
MSDLYHCGVLVFDLDESLARFESVYGVRFRDPEVRQLRAVPDADGTLPVDRAVRYSFSVGSEPPFIELIEAHDAGLFGRQHEEGLHHLGFWRADMAAAKRRQVDDGFEVDGSYLDADGSERVFYALNGTTRIESVNARLRPDYDAWLRSGAPEKSDARSSEPYHVAYIVADLVEAMPRYERMLGVRFREPMIRELRRGVGDDFRDPSGEDFEVVFTYSLGQRPYVELIQAGPGGPVFDLEEGERFHHVGVWVPDPPSAQMSQAAAGSRCEGRFFSPDGTERVWFATVDGLRAEFVNEAVRPATEEWLAGGRYWRDASHTEA